jgi:hypothetical protein
MGSGLAAKSRPGTTTVWSFRDAHWAGPESMNTDAFDVNLVPPHHGGIR